ncbi:MAG: hypothetical protein EOO11_14765 [Chitinophagaceae bacterium]|nr:MAG: hypothetical protein EOO11_14765 [Chitinophagaceae bacterium]
MKHLLATLATLFLTFGAMAQPAALQLAGGPATAPDPALYRISEEEEIDSVVTRYAIEPTATGADTLMVLRLRYERGGGLLEKQIALTPLRLKQMGYAGEQRPYFYQYRYDRQGRLVYYRDYLGGRYTVIDHPGGNEVRKTFDAASGKLLEQEVVPATATGKSAPAGDVLFMQ